MEGEEKDVMHIFTEKQRLVLDILIQHKTSKEIARTLGISPYTVDQRISLARAKLGVASRSELAARYQVMRGVNGHFSSEILPGPTAEARILEGPRGSAAEPRPAGQGGAPPGRDGPGDEAVPGPPAAEVENLACPTGGTLDYRVGPEVFEGAYGRWWRIGAIVGTALVMVMTVLGLFAIFGQLSAMLA